MRLHIPTALRWADLDAYGHVNNVEILRLLEEARVRAFWGPDEGETVPPSEDMPAAVLQRATSQTLTFVARQEIEYLLPIAYQRAPLDVQLWIGRIGGASLDICYEVYPPAGSAESGLYARADVTIVLVDSTTQRPRRITVAEREAWGPFVEEPLVMRRR